MINFSKSIVLTDEEYYTIVFIIVFIQKEVKKGWKARAMDIDGDLPPLLTPATVQKRFVNFQFQIAKFYTITFSGDSVEIADPEGFDFRRFIHQADLYGVIYNDNDVDFYLANKKAKRKISSKVRVLRDATASHE